MKKHIIFKFSLFLLMVILFASCEKVIDVNLKDAPPVLVVEGNVSDNDELQNIYLSKTVPFGADNQRVNTSGALVRIIEDGNTIYQLQELTPGHYGHKFRGKVGSTYELNIVLDGKQYTAKSTMPPKVVLDSVSITQIDFFNEVRKFVKLHYQDPENQQNAYRYILSVNSVKLKEFFVDNDRFNNGQYIERTIIADEPEIVRGDVISYDFQTIDLINYRYFFTLSQIAGGGGPPVAPSNPDSNISNGAQGYFSAHTSQRNGFTVNN